ncbi:MAG: fused MFS/spermidine synthase, partial [Verrucomicrobiia bacterium]
TGLYSINLLGAFLFTLAAPYFFFYWWGVQATVFGLAIAGLAIAALLAFGLPPDRPSSTTTISTGPTLHSTSERPTLDPILVLIAFLSGLFFFALEILWFHLIACALSNSTYTFPLLLAVVLAALAVGGAWVRHLAPRSLTDARLHLCWVLAALCLVMPLGTRLWPYMGATAALFGQHVTNFYLAETIKFLTALAFLGPIAIPAAAIFPLIFQGFTHGQAPGAKAIGYLCAINTAGCVSGALLAGFVLIPTLGSESSLHLLWGLSLAMLALIALPGRFFQQHPPVQKNLIAAAFGLVWLLALPPWDLRFLTGGYGVYFTAPDLNDEVVFAEEHYSIGFCTVRRSNQPNEFLGTNTIHTLLINGKFDADDASQIPAQISFSLIPGFFVPSQSAALVIGLGSGQSALIPVLFGFRQVDICEISPGHVRAAREWFHPINGHVLDHPNVRLIMEDGRNFLLRSNRSYDLISMEISSIWFAGASNLYSREFYRTARSRLKPGGILQQWVQIHHLTEAELLSIIGSLRAAFPNISLWISGGQGILVASVEPFTFNPRFWDQFLHGESFAEKRRLVSITSQDDLFSLLVLGPREIDAMLAAHPHTLSTDLNRWLEYHTPRYYRSPQPHSLLNLNFFRSHQDPTVSTPDERLAPATP